jgi:hypothetical protein
VTSLTQVDRDFIPSSAASESLIVDDFDKETGINSSGNTNIASQIKIKHKRLSRYEQRAAHIKWENANPNTYFEMVWAPATQGRDIHDFATLDFRIRRENNAIGHVTDFDVVLIDADGLASKPLHVSDYALMNGPGNENAVLKTVRIPLSVFQGVALTKIHSVRFIFNQSSSGHISLANVRVQRQVGLGTNLETRLAKLKSASTQVQLTQAPAEIVPVAMNRISKIRFLGKSFAMNGKSGVEIALTSQVPFPVMDRLPLLQIGDQTFKVSRYSDPKQLKELTFTLTNKEYQRLAKEKEVMILNGKVWKFGSLAKYAK